MSLRSKGLRWRMVLPGIAVVLAAGATGQEGLAPPEAVRTMLEELALEATEPFTAEAGHRNWYRTAANGRSCTSCHGETLTVPGRHEKTGKPIEPMARSVNPERLTERKHMDKWLLRNCKWTYGRECTAQEKGDILVWLSEQ